MGLGQRRRGTSLIEIIVVLVIVGVMARIAVPRMRPSSRATVERTARILVQDLDLARTRAYAARAMVRIVVADTIWSSYLDNDRDGNFSETATELTAFGTINTHARMRPVIFGRGAAAKLPTDPLAIMPTGTRRLLLNTRGAAEPFGTVTVFYLTSSSDANTVFAVEVSPSGNVRLWRWLNNTWQ
jgi:prepilin-type N-terminal cleavage/methylation domain-containing protein